jgi:putative peptide maturation dehydrogenase
MEPSMRLRRCQALLIAPREQLGLDMDELVRGSARLASRLEWVALMAHRDDAVVLDDAAIALLRELSPSLWMARDDLAPRHAPDTIDRMIANGVVMVEGDTADASVRDTHWHDLAAVAHRHLRWRQIDSQDARVHSGDNTDEASLLARLGPAPPAETFTADLPIGLLRPSPGALDEMARRRATCRNFDPDRALDAHTLGAVLHRVYSACAVDTVAGITVLKKAVPSAGGLHPVEAYLLVRRVTGIATGLYHYRPVDHALTLSRALTDEDAGHLAGVFVANQAWFADAPVQVILAARFRRNFWKYRGHAKAYRAVVLDAGHLSQMQYLAATELGLGAFITAAVNEGDIEDAFGLDPMEEGVLAVTGFGHRGRTMDHLEFDPLHAVWPAS